MKKLLKYLLFVTIFFNLDSGVFERSAKAAAADLEFGDWFRAETDHFIFYSDGSEKSLREDAIKLERFDYLIRQLTGIKSSYAGSKLTVLLVSGEAKVRSLHGGKSANVAGFYDATSAGAFAVVPRHVEGIGESKTSVSTEDVILFHEYGHHLLLQTTSSAVPGWYNEGFAEYIGNTLVEDQGTAKLGLPNFGRAYSLLEQTPIAMEKLLDASPAELSRDATHSFYAQSWLLTHYLSHDPARKGQLTSYLKSFGDGQDSLAAARASFGDLKKLRKDLDSYVRKPLRYLPITKPLPLPAKLDVVRLDKGASEAVLLQFELSRGTDEAERDPLAAKLRLLAAKYPRSLSVMTALAEAELDLNNFDAAGAAADSAIAIFPGHARALLWKGLSIARKLADKGADDPAGWKSARNWVVKANRANPDDALILFEFYKLAIMEGKSPSDNALTGLERAVDLVPQEDGIRMTYVAALIDKKRYTEAVKMLQPLINDPHNPELSARARVVAKDIEARIEAARKSTVPASGATL